MNTKQLQNIISQGEGLTVEFKKAKNQLPNNLFETVCAFLNRSGGEILLGVHDDRTIEGINENVIEQLTKEIANLSNNPQKLFPSFLLEPQIIDFKEEDVFITEVPLVAMSKNDPVNAPVNDLVNDLVNERQKKIYRILQSNSYITGQELANQLIVSLKTIKRDLAKLKSLNLIQRVGSDKTGHWRIIN
jgi:predicted HTH transcriptional regulator